MPDLDGLYGVILRLVTEDKSNMPLHWQVMRGYLSWDKFPNLNALHKLTAVERTTKITVETTEGRELQCQVFARIEDGCRKYDFDGGLESVIRHYQDKVEFDNMTPNDAYANCVGCFDEAIRRK